MTTITGANISLLRMKVLLSGLKLEMLGMTRRGASCYSIIKRETGLTGSRQKVYSALEKMYLEEKNRLGDKE